MKQTLILLGMAAGLILVACSDEPTTTGTTTTNMGGAGGEGMGGMGGTGGTGAMGGMGGMGGGMGGMGGMGGGMGGMGMGGMGGGGGAPMCLKCSQVLTQMSDPMNACDGESAMLLMALQKCSCVDKCTAQCNNNACMGMAPSAQCQGCVATQCNTEYQACLADN
jgi:hypothetical protein